MKNIFSMEFAHFYSSNLFFFYYSFPFSILIKSAANGNDDEMFKRYLLFTKSLSVVYEHI